MATHRESPAQARILFCPFCREGFEERPECPEHGLLLVPIDALPPPAERGPAGIHFFLDPRFGRGPVLLGALIVLVGFATPFVRSGRIGASALEVAIDGAHNLWLTAGAAFVILWILWRRRNPASMRAARVAVVGLAVGAGLPLLYTARRIELVASARLAEVEWQWGVWLLLAGLSIIAVGGPFLGRARGRRLP